MENNSNMIVEEMKRDWKRGTSSERRRCKGGGRGEVKKEETITTFSYYHIHSHSCCKTRRNKRHLSI
jgi:hypothetical protein